MKTQESTFVKLEKQSLARGGGLRHRFGPPTVLSWDPSLLKLDSRSQPTAHGDRDDPQPLITEITSNQH